MSPRPLLLFGLTLAAPLVAAGPTPPSPDIPASLDEIPRAAVSFSIPEAPGKRFELEHGAVAYLVPDPTLPLVEVAVALRVGSFLDPPGEVGLASFTGAMLRRGGTSERSAEDFDATVDILGAQIRTSTGVARGGASLSATTWVLDDALALFGELLLAPGFQADRVESSTRNLLESLSRRNQDPVQILEREWEWLLYGLDRFSTRPVTPTTVERLDREALTRFHAEYWRPGRLIFAVSGDFEPDQMLEKLNGLLRAGTAEPPTPRPTELWPPSAPEFQPSPGLYHVEFEAPQAKVAFGRRLPRLGWDHPDRFALEVLREIVGGTGAISRLGGRLRTAESLAYRVSVRLDPGDLWDGDFQVFFDTRADATGAALAAALEEIERLQAEGVRPQELEVVKTTLLSKLRLRFDTAEEIAGYFAEDEMLGRPHSYWERYRDAVLAMTGEEVQRVAREYLDPEAFQFLVVGPWSQISLGAPAGESRPERIVGSPVRHLPRRDPSTMAPIEPESDGPP